MISAGHFITADGCQLQYEIEGQGAPVLWQHGLGATAAQPAEVFPSDTGLQRITLLCRGHGESDLGEIQHLSIQQFAGDAIALLGHLGIRTVAIGGISLGAAIALNIAACFPNRVTKLVLARPAWIDQPAPQTMALYPVVAELLSQWGTDEGLRKFRALAETRALQKSSPDNVASLESFFARPHPTTTIALLSTIPQDWPHVTRVQMASLALPTLVIGNGQDHVHPLAYAHALQQAIPNAEFCEITSKSISRATYVQQFRAALAEFLNRR